MATACLDSFHKSTMEEELSLLTSIKDQLTLTLNNIETYLRRRLSKMSASEDDLQGYLVDLRNALFVKIDKDIPNGKKRELAFKMAELFCRRKDKPTSLQIIELLKTIGLPLEEDDLVLNLYHEGLNFKEISQETGIDIKEISQIIFHHEGSI